MSKTRTNQNKPRNNSAPVAAVSPVEQSSKAQRSVDRSTIEVQSRKARGQRDSRSFTPSN